MRRLYEDLWQTETERPFPYLVTRAYILKTDVGNCLVYNTGLASELQGMEELGGLTRQYLSHIHEAGPSCADIRSRFRSDLWCPEAESEAVASAVGEQPDGKFRPGETHFASLEFVAAPGHTPGSTCFVYRSETGATYLFTGDTLGVNSDGDWVAGYIAGISDWATLRQTMRSLLELQPDVVISSAFGDAYPVNEVTQGDWSAALDQAIAGLDGIRNGDKLKLT